MVEGISKKDLEKRRDQLVTAIHDSEVAEKENSGKIHEAIAEKSKLKIKIVDAKNQLVQLDELIASCKELSGGIAPHSPTGITIS